MTPPLRTGSVGALVMLSLGVLMAILAPSVQAHPLAPSLLRITLESPFQASVLWKQPRRTSSEAALRPRLPADCMIKANDLAVDASGAVNELLRVTCETPLSGRSVHFDGLGSSDTYVIAEMIDPAGRRSSEFLSASNVSVQIPSATGEWASRKGFVMMGIDHLLGGLDHMLFILGLALLLRYKVRALVVAFTSFTIGHSLALAGAWLAWGSVASNGSLLDIAAVVETLIMLSLVWMALELLNEHRPPARISVRRAPFVLTLGFGLVHGSGFAGSLLAQLAPADIGLWSDALWNIAAFNLGLELGQLLLVCALLFAIYIVQETWQSRVLLWLNPAVAYGMGGISCYWLLRLAL